VESGRHSTPQSLEGTWKTITQAALEGDPRKVFHAICMDPLTSAVLSLAEIKEMTDEMLTRNSGHLPQFSRFS
jgi:alpha-galactosidase